MTLAPFPIKYLIVGTAALILVSSEIFWASSNGTLRSALTNTFFPLSSASDKSPTLLLAIATIPLGPFPFLPATSRILWVTLADSTCSDTEEPANPNRRFCVLREMAVGAAMALDEPLRAVERRENEVEAAAAIDGLG